MFIAKLKAFMRNRKRPVFLVLDGHPAHRAKIVAAYVQSLKGRLELHFLPGYAPDLNPDEFVWNYLRQNGVTKTPLKQNEKHSRTASSRTSRKSSAARAWPVRFFVPRV
jgi:transposase